MAPRLYLAGPDVFLPDARRVGDRKRDLCRRYALEGLFPLDNDSPVDDDPAAIFRANCALMERADIGLFNLTPFRGPSADVGTVFELGFLFARRRPVFGYTAATAPYAERVDGTFSGSTLVDADDLSIEDFGLGDNLMIERAIAEAGGTIHRVAEPDGTDRLAAFAAFEACLADIARLYGETMLASNGS